jgi:hypothetical protein
MTELDVIRRASPLGTQALNCQIIMATKPKTGRASNNSSSNVPLRKGEKM